MNEDELQKHNRIGVEIGHRILLEFPDPINQLVVMESIIAGVISVMKFQPQIKTQSQSATLALLMNGVQFRLDEQNQQK